MLSVFMFFFLSYLFALIEILLAILKDLGNSKRNEREIIASFLVLNTLYSFIDLKNIFFFVMTIQN